MKIRDSARKRGHRDEDMRHAGRNAVRIVDPLSGRDVALFLGPDRIGKILDVGVADAEGDDARVIHCMDIRNSLKPLLRR